MVVAPKCVQQRWMGGRGESCYSNETCLYRSELGFYGSVLPAYTSLSLLNLLSDSSHATLNFFQCLNVFALLERGDGGREGIRVFFPCSCFEGSDLLWLQR